MKVLIVGCGNMGGAMLTGWLAGGLPANAFTVVDPMLAAVPEGVELLREVPSAGSDFDAVLLGFKPQQLAEGAATIAPVAGSGTTILSILAGVDLETLRRRFPAAGQIVRVMPNLAAALGKSPIALVSEGGSGTTPLIDQLVAPLGPAEWLAEESLMDLVTALTGSGPAFVYRFIEALAAGAAALGLPRDQAERLALSMVDGATALAVRADVNPGELARRVASPGGTTQKGLDVLDADSAMLALIEATLRAARDRSAEMAADARALG